MLQYYTWRDSSDMSMYTLVLHSTYYQPALQTAIQPALGVVTPYSPSCVPAYVSLHAGSGQVSVQEAPYASMSTSIPFTTFFSKPSKLQASVSILCYSLYFINTIYSGSFHKLKIQVNYCNPRCLHDLRV